MHICSDIINSVCESDMVICKRRQAVYLSLSINDPDGDDSDDHVYSKFSLHENKVSICGFHNIGLLHE